MPWDSQISQKVHAALGFIGDPLERQELVDKLAKDASTSEHDLNNRLQAAIAKWNTSDHSLSEEHRAEVDKLLRDVSVQARTKEGRYALRHLVGGLDQEVEPNQTYTLLYQGHNLDISGRVLKECPGLKEVWELAGGRESVDITEFILSARFGLSESEISFDDLVEAMKVIEMTPKERANLWLNDQAVKNPAALLTLGLLFQNPALKKLGDYHFIRTLDLNEDKFGIINDCLGLISLEDAPYLITMATCIDYFETSLQALREAQSGPLGTIRFLRR